MKSKRISQAEARGLRKRVEQLEGLILSLRRTWNSDYLPNSVFLSSITLVDTCHAGREIHTARKLGHAIVCQSDGGKSISFYALPAPSVPA